MLFNSLTFVVFLALVHLAYRVARTWRAKKVVLLVASCVFYAAWNPPFVLLLVLSVVVDWFAARGMARANLERTRRLFLALSLCTNLGLLAFFKYAGFLLDNFVAALSLFGVHYQPPTLGVVLPVGISFYTFQTLSYTIDVYRRDLEPCPSFLDFGLYVAFFPQLVAGPIVRAIDFLPQCASPRLATPAQLGWGFALLVVGLFQKVMFADVLLAPVVEHVYANAQHATFSDAWIGTLAFSAQIFFDFAGYSTCAIGVAMTFGFALPDNFRSPYGAIGFSDFWRRWHISLSTWLRDYLYIPLGGNRANATRTNINLMLTMLVGGLWHGASWRFVVWGGLHGFYLVAERLWRRRFGRVTALQALPAQVLLMLGTYALVCVTWVFFRADDFAKALDVVRAMLHLGSGAGVALRGVELYGTLGVTAALLASHGYMRERTLEEVAERMPWWGRALVLGLAMIALALTQGTGDAFIYFQF